MRIVHTGGAATSLIRPSEAHILAGEQWRLEAARASPEQLREACEPYMPTLY